MRLKEGWASCKLHKEGDPFPIRISFRVEPPPAAEHYDISSPVGCKLHLTHDILALTAQLPDAWPNSMEVRRAALIVCPGR